MSKPFVSMFELIVDAIIQDVADKPEDTQFTLKELVDEHYRKFKAEGSAITSLVYKLVYEQLVIRDLAYVTEIEDGMELKDVIWSRQETNSMYLLYLRCGNEKDSWNI